MLRPYSAKWTGTQDAASVCLGTIPVCCLSLGREGFLRSVTRISREKENLLTCKVAEYLERSCSFEEVGWKWFGRRRETSMLCMRDTLGSAERDQSWVAYNNKKGLEGKALEFSWNEWQHADINHVKMMAKLPGRTAW